MESFVRSLSVNPNRPCFFLQYGETFIMLDCAMDLRPCLRFLPVTQVFTPALAQIKRWDHGNSFLYSTDNDILEHEGSLFINGAPEFEIPNFEHVDPADLHYILISNFAQIFALPYLINERNFNGKIFATAPTVQLAKDVFQDMSEYLTSYSTSAKAEKWKVKEVLQMLPAVLQSTRPHLWKSLCSMEALEMALKKVEVVNFRQTIPLENSLVVTAYSSGFAIGSCNWCIQSPEEKICYFADSSTVNTHLSSIDLEDMKNADVMLVAALNMDPGRSLNDSLDRLSKTVVDTIKDGGNVLIPFSRVDLLIDLLEYLYLYTDQLPVSVPINVISSTARSMLSLSQVYSEWLSKEYRDKAYLPEEPFVHGEMMRNNRLQIFPSVDGKFSETFKSPCIVFCSHYALRFGPGVHLMSQWKTAYRNNIIFTDSEFHFDEILAPYRPFAIKITYCPMDTRLTPVQLTKVVGLIEPKNLVIHARYLTPYDATVADTADQVVRVPPNTKLLPYIGTTEIPLPVQHKWVDTLAKSSFLASIPMSDVSDCFPTSESKDENSAPVPPPSKVLIGRIYGSVKTLDNQYMIEPAPVTKKITSESGRKYPALCFEKPDIWKLTRFLRKEGFHDVVSTVDPDSTATKIESAEFHFTITIIESATEVATSGPTMETRKRLKRVMELIRRPKSQLLTGVELEDPSVMDVLAAPEGVMEIDPAGGKN